MVNQRTVARRDLAHPHLVDDLLSPERRVHRRQGGGAHLEAARVVVELELADVEAKLVSRGEPTRDAGLELVDEVAANVEVR